MGISMFALTILGYNENRNITITQMLPGAEKLYVTPELSSKYLDGHCYRIEQTGVATKYSAASPFSVGDNLAEASFNINTALGWRGYQYFRDRSLGRWNGINPWWMIFLLQYF